MTVRELIERLEAMSQDLEVEFEIIRMGERSVVTQEVDDIYESTDNKIVIQGYKY